MSIEITGLTIYPVKSMKGIALERSTLTGQGLLYDRRWMVVTASGRFNTQRNLARMALVHTELTDGGVTLSLQGHGSITIPASGSVGEEIRTKVWGDVCETIDEGQEVSRWLTAALESRTELRLVHMAPGFVRPQGKPEHLGEDTHTYFADAAPFLIANESSLNALNQELTTRGESPVPMDRFRPNIVLRGLQAFTEHTIPAVRSESYSFRFCHPCERCVITTINQDTAEKNPDWQPFNTLKEINPVAGKKPAPAFGQNATLLSGDRATVAVGDRLVL
jgi:uncharacterized protein YcbX